MKDLGIRAIKFLISIFKNIYFQKKIFYLIEYNKWANYNDAINLKKYFKNKFLITNEILGIKNSIIHIGTHYKLFKKGKIINFDRTNKLIIFWPHLDLKNQVSFLIKKNISKILKINTCSLITKKNLIKYGIPKEKIIITPLSIDTNLFKDTTKKQKFNLRKKYGIPKNKLILGSFIKDGEGFREGNKPKNIKNPELLIDAIKLLKNKKDYFFILSGPARGYLKNALKKLGINFIHKNCKNKKELSELYKLVDVTVINSKIEGGPYSLLESLSSGVPVISTKVGMSLDVLKNNYNGFLINKNDSFTLKKKLNFFFRNRNNLNIMRKNSRKSAKNYSLKRIGNLYKSKLYYSI